MLRVKSVSIQPLAGPYRVACYPMPVIDSVGDRFWVVGSGGRWIRQAVVVIRHNGTIEWYHRDFHPEPKGSCRPDPKAPSHRVHLKEIK